MIMRSPAQIRQFLDENLWRFDLGTQYLGDEPNVVFKDWDACSVRTLMVASWAYEQAAGNQSIPAVYKAINIAREDFLCDRFYLPATPRDMRLLEKNGIPVFGIEYKHAMTDFDVVSTSISYPVLAMSFVKMLSMSGVPVRWRERGGTDPFVLVGGQAYAAPEVLAPVVDAFYLGEAEDEQGNPGIGRVMERISQYKQEGRWSTDRVGCYEAMAREFPYLYFPRFVEVIYDYQDRSHVGLEKPSKQVVGYRSLLEGMRMPFERHYVRDLDAIPPLDDAPLLYTDAGNASGDIEVARGCPAWCSFCRLSWVTKPYRQRSVDYMVEFGKNLKRNMGGTHVAYVAPDFPMHTEKKRLTKALVENVTDEVDGAAMRIDDFIADDQFVTLSSYAGMDGVTLGLEGNSQRMRDLVGKGVSDAETREAVRRALEAGVRKVKLFMISNMPGEDEGDIERIVQLARDLAEIRDSMGKSNVVIQFSWTPLLIEANTPFQWFAPTPANYHLSHMWDAMRDLKIDFKIGSKSEVNKVTFFQLCQRASREIGEVLVDTMLELNVACWGGVPKSTRDLLDANMVKHGFLNGLEDAFDERGKDDLFGWEFISTGVSQSLLWDVYQQMVEFLEITDSTTYDEQFEGSEYHGAEWLSRCDERCLGKACGACTREDLEIRKQYTAADDESIDLSTVDAIDERSVAVKVRARLDKSEAYRLVTNDHWRFTLRRALYRAQEATDLPANIVKRSIVFASDAIGFKDWTHGTDYVEFALTKPVSSQALEKFLAAVEEELVSPTGQPWMQVGLWKIHPPTAGSIRADLDLTLYEVEVEEELSTLQARLRWWDEQESVDMTIRAPVTYFGPTMETVNAKEYVDGLWLAREGHRVVVRMLVRGRPSPYNVLAAFLGNPSWLEYARFPARRVDSFVQWETDQWDFFFPACQQCGVTIPVNVLEQSFDTAHCPRCKDESEGRLIPV